MKRSRSDRSKLHCLLHLDYPVKTGKPPEAAILTGIHLEIVTGRSALSLTGGILGIESAKETGTETGMLGQGLREHLRNRLLSMQISC